MQLRSRTFTCHLQKLQPLNWVVLHEFKVGLSYIYIYMVPFSIIIIIIHKFSKCQLQKSAVKIQSLNLEIRLERTKPLTKAKLCSCKKSQSQKWRYNCDFPGKKQDSLNPEAQDQPGQYKTPISVKKTCRCFLWCQQTMENDFNTDYNLICISEILVQELC